MAAPRGFGAFEVARGQPREMLIRLLFGMLAAPAMAIAQLPTFSTLPGLHAEIRPHAYRVPMGSPVWATFRIENTGGEPITLTVPGTEPEIPSPESGLPITHVFSGGSSATGVSVVTDSGRRWDTPVGYRQPGHAPILMIAPRSSVGITVDLREYFPSLRGAGRYRIAWAPYGGRVIADGVVIAIAALKRAEVVTDAGTMIVRFFYTEAPKTVANFIELAETGFYTGKHFHRLEPGYFVQGGCPRGDGTGIRPDGKRVTAEFNGRPMQKGTLAMALLEDEPDSASCQFFICNTRMKVWDGRYTVFGELVGDASFEALDRLMGYQVDAAGHPVTRVSIQNVRLVDSPPDDLP
jgi:peptidyl-prolyl cis-trans isomerase B (cyclophilin B)